MEVISNSKSYTEQHSETQLLGKGQRERPFALIVVLFNVLGFHLCSCLHYTFCLENHT